MGYTHYWKKTNANQDQFDVSKKKVRKIVIDSTCDFKLCDGNGRKGTSPIMSGGVISFNGEGDESHETFFLPAKIDEMDSFEFCKTAQKEYDTVVVACLHVLEEDGIVNFSSDGDDEELAEGRNLAKKILG